MATQRSARLLAASTGQVGVESNMFRLMDAGPPSGDPADLPEPPAEGELASARGGVLIALSALGDHYAELILESWSAEPADPDPAPDPGWERTATVRMRLADGHLESASGLLLEEGAHHLDLPPGDYTVRLWTAGGAETRRRHAEGELTPRGVERWIVRLWPTVNSY